MKKLTYTLLALSLMLMACSQPEQTSPTLNRTWASIGSGWLLDIRDSTDYAFYNLTTQYCYPFREAKLSELLPSITLSGDTLALLQGVITYKFIPVDSVPEVCRRTLSTGKQQDPLFNFEVFAETVGDHYAFFQINEIDWPELYATQRAKLVAEPTSVMLYQIIEETLEMLNDNHGFIEADDELYEALEQLPGTEEEQEPPAAELPEIGDIPLATMVSKHHLLKNNTADSWLIDWGSLSEDIGFLQIKTMWLYADLKIPDTLIQEMGYVDAYVATFQKMDEGTYIDLEVASVRKIMSRAMADLRDKKALVIDLRFNGGGQDAVSLEILRWFNPERRQIATERLRIRDTFSPDLPLYLEGSAEAFTRPVYLLTSQQTGSAAETFSLASLSLPHFQRVGQHTEGALSTTLEKQLPNGWFFAISNEILEDMQGNLYENSGIPVDHEIPYPDDRQAFFHSVADDLAADKKRILEAIATLR